MIFICPKSQSYRVRTNWKKSWKMTFFWKNHGILILGKMSSKNHGKLENIMQKVCGMGKHFYIYFDFNP
jgi:hypothetical protein